MNYHEDVVYISTDDTDHADEIDIEEINGWYSPP